MATISGTPLPDLLVDGPGDDLVLGLDQADTLLGGLGADTLNGGSGRDRANYQTAPDGVVVSLNAGGLSGLFAIGDQFISIEDLSGSRFDDDLRGNGLNNRIVGLEGNDILSGLAGDDSLIGSDGNDTLFGGLGADKLQGGSGADLILGGADVDTVSYTASTAAVQVDLATSAGLGGHAQGDVIRGVENIIGSRFDDTLTGDNGDNRLNGGQGEDTLFGQGGNDAFVGSQGGDAFFGGQGIDTVIYRKLGGQVIMDERLGTSSGAARGDSYDSIERFLGSDVGDSFVLGDLDNEVMGRGGNDFIDAGRGDDTLIGGEGGDFLHGGPGSDWAVYGRSTAAITVDLQTGAASGGHAQGDTLSHIENVVGSRHGDNIQGSILDNHLVGNRGDDTLTGHGGADTLKGGQGVDTFVYVDRDHHQATGRSDALSLGTFSSSDADSILGFVTGLDKIQITQSEFSNTVVETQFIADLGLASENDHALAFHDGDLFHVSYASAGDFALGIAQVRHLAEFDTLAALDVSDFVFV